MSGVDPGGIGGTGQVAAEGGLGGTGIVGVVTGFASICVNGLEVQYTPDTTVWQDGMTANTGVLAVGQVVALQALQSAEGLSAQRIDVLDAVVGPISALNLETGHIALVGQIAQAQEPADLVGLAVGDWARVSGLARANGEIRATRVLRATPGTALLRGKVRQLAGSSFMIGATRIEGSGLRWLAELTEGQEVLLRGQWDGMVFEAGAGTREPTKALIQRSQAVVLEGYVQAVNGQHVELDYAQLTLGRDVRVSGGLLGDLRVGQKVQVHGRIGTGLRVTVDRLEYLREGRRGEGANRRAATAAVSSGDDFDDDASTSDHDSEDSSGRGSDASSDGTSSSGQGRGRGRGRGGDSSGSGSSGGDSSGSGSSGGDSSGSGSSGGDSSGSGSSGSGSSGGDSDGQGRGRGRGRGGSDKT